MRGHTPRSLILDETLRVSKKYIGMPQSVPHKWISGMTHVRMGIGKIAK